MAFILGIIVGLMLAIINLLAFKRYQPDIERTANVIVSKTKIKGEVFSETDEDRALESFINNLPRE